MMSYRKKEMMSDSREERLWNKDFVIVMIANTGICFCNYFFATTLPIYAQILTGTTAYSGLMMGVFALAAVAVRPFSGILADKYGRTKLLITGAFLCTAACVLNNFAAVLLLLLFVRVLHGIGFGMHSTASGAVAADVIPRSRLTEGIGYFGLFNTIATAVAPGIALAIIGTGEIGKFGAIFKISAVVSLASMIFDCFITYERKDKHAQHSVVMPLSLRTGEDEDKDLPKTFLGFEYAAFLPAVVSVLVFFGISSVSSFLPLFAMEKHLGNIGLFFTFNAAGMFLSRLLMGKVADKRGLDIVIVPGIIGMAVCLGLIPLVNSLGPLLLIGFPLGLAQGAVGPACNSLMFNRCSEKRRGTASAAFFSSVDLGFGVGSIAFGVISAAYNYDTVFWCSMVCVGLALVVYLIFVSERKQKLNPVEISREI